MDALKERLDAALKENQDLKKDLISAQRIQIDQSKALEKLTFEDELPNKIKGLMDELRVEKDKVSKLRD